MISPARTYNIYEDILRQVAEEAGRPFNFVQRRSYQEINDLLVGGQIDLAFICSGAFASLPQDASFDLLAVPVVHGAPTYYSFIIARSESDITQLTDLKGKSFAFTDPLSNTGYFYPLARLGDIGTTPAAFFSNTILTGSHDRSITAVYRKLADAAAVDSLVYEHLVIPGSRYFGELKVIEVSPGFPIPPFVSPTSVAPELRRSFRQSLLQLHTTSEGRELLKAIEVERFVDGDPSSYKLIESYSERAQRVLKQ
jgi:phosphonate transport system substrate-binding protein